MALVRQVPDTRGRQSAVRLVRRIRARLPTYLSDIRENPSWLLMFVFGRTMLARRLHWRRARPAPAAADRATMFGGVDCEAVVEALRTQGLYQGLRLPPAVCDEIARFALHTPCFGNFDRRMTFLPAARAQAEESFGCALHSGHYFERALECGAVLAVQRDPLLHDIAARYLGGQARLMKTRIWWNFPSCAVSDADKSVASVEKYHFDLDDWRTLKFFFHLVPVSEGCGQHVYVRKSHTRRLLKHQLTLFVGHPEHEIVRFYGAENVTVLTGPAGFGFAEDPFGFHMGTLPRIAPRLMLEIGFGVSRPSRRGFHGEPVLR